MSKAACLDSGSNKVILDHVRSCGGSADVNLNELALRSGFQSTTLCHTIKRLARMGLIEREKGAGRKLPRITLITANL